MPIPLFNSIASWLLRKRYHQIELFLKYPLDVQDEVLRQLLDFSQDTMMKNGIPFFTLEKMAHCWQEQGMIWTI